MKIELRSSNSFIRNIYISKQPMKQQQLHNSVHQDHISYSLTSLPSVTLNSYVSTLKIHNLNNFLSLSLRLVSQIEVRRSASEEVSKPNNELHYFSTVKHNAGNSKHFWFDSAQCLLLFIDLNVIMNFLSPNRNYFSHSPQSVHWPSDMAISTLILRGFLSYENVVFWICSPKWIHLKLYLNCFIVLTVKTNVFENDEAWFVMWHILCP